MNAVKSIKNKLAEEVFYRTFGNPPLVDASILGQHGCLKAQPHAAMLHTCDGVFQSPCDAGKLLAMLCDVNSNMFNNLPRFWIISVGGGNGRISLPGTRREQAKRQLCLCVLTAAARS